MARRANLKKGIKGPMKMKQLGGFGGSGMVQAQADLKKKRQQKEAEAANRAAANASPRAKKQNTPQGSMAKDQKGSFIEPNKELKFGGVKKYKQGGIEDRDAGYGSSLKKEEYAGRTTRPRRSNSITPKPAPSNPPNTESLKDTSSTTPKVQAAVAAKNKQWGEGFSEAFAAARKAGKGTFTFKGRTFGTRKKGESQEEYNAAMKRASGRDQKMSTTSSRGPSQIENKKPTASLQATRVTVPKVEEKNRKQKRQERKASKNSTSPMTDRRTKSISKTSSKSGPSKPKPSKSKSEEMGMKKLNKALGRSMKRGGKY